MSTTRSDLADVPVRWSWLSHFGSSPLHARHAALHGREPSTSMRLGTAGHVVAFDQPYVVWAERRAGKLWEEFRERHERDGTVVLSAKEYSHGCAMRDALRSHPLAAPLLYGDGVIREQHLRWERHGRACSSRPDARKPGEWIVDLKTCRTAHPSRFQAAARWSGYCGQLRFYQEADLVERGLGLGSLRTAGLFIVAIEPVPPYAITVFELDASARRFGERSVAACWEQLVACEASNAWPSYSQSIVPFTADDGEGGLGLEISDSPTGEMEDL